MVNVRIDANGLPKGPVYEPTTPAVHRSGVTAIDSSDPPDTSGAVDCAGYQQCHLDITITGTGLQSLDVQVLLWNSRQGSWFAGASRRFYATGSYALTVDARGNILFLKVTDFSGTSFNLSADYTLS